MASAIRPLSASELEALGVEFDALRARTVAKIGEEDARYIRRVVKAQRYLDAGGRVLLYASAVPLVGWLLFWPFGTLMLGIAKILENMEIGHNVIHGQYDFMRDPHLNGKTYEWDIVGTADNWRKTHNFKHHTYTNVRGMDDDIGYGLLRVFPEQRWRPFYLAQPLVAILFALAFEWGVAIQDLELGKYLAGRKSKAQLKREWQPVARKMRRQIVKDYVIFPLLAGPFFLPVLAGNLCANIIRNLWTYTVIFCGHFTADVHLFPKSVLENETRGHWYWRQILGSSNLRGSKLFHVMTGNLSHQIEHHLFPDIPAWRYEALAREVRAICARYGVPYNTGRMSSQFAQVVWRILRHALPSRPARTASIDALPA